MSKKLTFTVTVEFADKIVDDNEVIEVAENIARAIENETDNMVAPENSETYTVGIEVRPQFVDKIITRKII